MDHGRPVALIRHWIDAGSAIVWKPIVQKFLTWEPAFETMCMMPMVFDRQVLPLLRDYAVGTHGISISDYILRQPTNSFSEFNVALNFAMRFCPYMFSWRIANPATDGIPRDRIIQRWSWSENGVDPFREDYERILAA
jgi:hypothetical protein